MASFGTTIGLIMVLVVILAVYFRDTFDSASIRGKRIVITGSSTGIGEQLAYEYSKLGARVLLTSRRAEVLEKVVTKCKELGAEEAFYIPLDMGRLNHTEALILEAGKRFGGLDHLILNHISSNYLELWNSDWDRYQQVIDVNLRAYISLATNAVPLLAKSSGSIAVVSSIADGEDGDADLTLLVKASNVEGKVGVPFSALYSCSKFGLSGFFNAYRMELQLQRMNISITEFIIGSINTANARKFSSKIFDEDMFSTSAADTAYRIMSGTQQRERTVYFPRYAFVATVFRDLIPGITDWLLLSEIKGEVKETLTQQ